MPGHLSVEGELNIFDRFAIIDRLRLFDAYGIEVLALLGSR